jgi:hypothetical protein
MKPAASSRVNSPLATRGDSQPRVGGERRERGTTAEEGGGCLRHSPDIAAATSPLQSSLPLCCSSCLWSGRGGSCCRGLPSSRGGTVYRVGSSPFFRPQPLCGRGWGPT